MTSTVRHTNWHRVSCAGTLREMSPELAQRAGMYEVALERLFLEASGKFDITRRQAGQAISRAYYNQKRRTDGKLLRAPVHVMAELHGRPGRITVRAVARPEPDYSLLARVSVDHFQQLWWGILVFS